MTAPDQGETNAGSRSTKDGIDDERQGLACWICGRLIICMLNRCLEFHRLMVGSCRWNG